MLSPNLNVRFWYWSSPPRMSASNPCTYANSSCTVRDARVVHPDAEAGQNPNIGGFAGVVGRHTNDRVCHLVESMLVRDGYLDRVP